MFADVKAFENKLEIFMKPLSEENFMHFPTCNELLNERKNVLSASTNKCNEVINLLKEEFRNRFKDFHDHMVEIQMFQNPFTVSPEEVPGIYQMKIIDLQANDALKATFKENSLLEFYSCLPEEYSDLKKFAAGMFSVFGSTYICEQTFSKMKLVKSILRSRLTDEHLYQILKLSVTNIEDIAKLVNKMQHQISH